MDARKKIVYFGTLTNTGGETIVTPSSVGKEVYEGFNKLDLIINTTTFVGSATPGFSVSIFELLGLSSAYLKTGTSGTVTTPGTTVYEWRASGNSVAGKGHDKKLTSNIQGTITSLNADIYMVLWN